MHRPAAAVALPLAFTCLALTSCDLAGGRTPGEKLWRKHCADCHGLDARGNTPRFMGEAYADLSDDGWRTGGDRYSIETVIREGAFGKMPPNPNLTKEEIRLIIEHLYQLRHESGN